MQKWNKQGMLSAQRNTDWSKPEVKAKKVHIGNNIAKGRISAINLVPSLNALIQVLLI